MICPNCGAELNDSSNECEYCGTKITVEMQKEREQLNKEGCPSCGSTNISFDRENQGYIKRKKKTTAIHSTVGVCRDCGYTWNIQETKSKKKTWLWIIGWIFIFPLPLTLVLRKKRIKPVFKYGILGIAWLLFIAICFGGNSKDTNTELRQESNTIIEDNANLIEEDKSIETTDTVEELFPNENVEITVEPKVNSDDGTVLFSVTANLPEKTKLNLVLSNENEYKSEQTVILLGRIGYTSEFNDNGNGLNGNYTVTLYDTLENKLFEQDFSFDWSVNNNDTNIQEIEQNDEKIVEEELSKKVVIEENLLIQETPTTETNNTSDLQSVEQATKDAQPIKNGTVVYISNSGKIHSKSSCSGMKSYTEMSLDEALNIGYEKCKKCYK